MLQARVKGGLGNQLYIYAATRAVSIRNNIPLYLDVRSGFEFDYEYERSYKLFNFKIKAVEIDTNNSIVFFSRLRRFILKRINDFIPQSKKSYIVNCDFDSLKKVKLPHRKNLVLDGLWQSQLYFDDCEKQIRTELTFNDNVKSGVRINPAIDLNGHSVAVHFRFFGPLGDSRNVPIYYYEKAVQQLINDVKCPNFILFSDDKESAKLIFDKFNVDYKIIEYKVEDVETDVAELYLMSLCRHHIIANSTFSWWGAWIGKNKEQRVFYPINKGSCSWNWDYAGQMSFDWKGIGVSYDVE